VSQPIDVVYVELRSRGEQDTARDIRDALSDIERDVQNATKDIEKSFSDATTSIETDFRQTGREIDDTARGISTSLDDAILRSADGFDALTDAARRTREDSEAEFRAMGLTLVTELDSAAQTLKQSWVRLGDDADSALKKVRESVTETGEAIGRETGEGLADGLRDVTDSASQTTKALAGLGISGGPTGLLALLGIGAALTPVITAVGGALLDLSGAVALLPGLLGVAASAGGTLILAFQGIGEAIKAVAGGDLDKIDQALENLPKSARVFVKEVVLLRDEFDRLRSSVQQAFFAQITGDLTLLAKSALPTLQKGLTGIASALGNATEQLIAFLRQRTIVETFAQVFTITQNIIDQLTPSFLRLFDSILEVVGGSLPFIDRLISAVGSLVDEFAGFLSESVQTGDLEDFLESTFATFKDLGALLGSLGRLVASLFGDTGDEGRTLIQILTDITDKFTAFFESAEGQEAIQDSLTLMLSLVQGISNVTDVITAGAAAFQHIQDDIASFAATIGSAIDSVVNFFQSLWNGVQQVGSTIAAFFESVGAFFTNLGQQIAAGFNSAIAFIEQVVSFFQSLPGRIVAAVQALPGLLVSVFTQVFDAVTFAIGFGIGTIIQHFLTLPGRIYAAILSVIELVRNVFVTTSSTAVAVVIGLVAAVVSFFQTLPGRVLSAISAVTTFVRNTFNSARSAATEIATNIVDRVTSILRSLPGRAASALSSFTSRVSSTLRSAVSAAVDIGQDIMNGIIRGINSGVSAAVNAAVRAARNILRGMEEALGIGSPSKVFAAEVGVPITQGISSGIEQGTPDLLRTLNSVASGLVPSVTNNTNAGDNTQSLVFGPGSVQVTVMGNSSEAEARALGSAVGGGVIDAVTRRRVQLRVRTI
jgi:phage-related protein